MKVIIIEDEIPAAEKLERYLHKFDHTIEILARLTSIQESVNWLTSNPEQELDLIFMDIQLTDGLSFEIFRRIPVHKPVIFTTAFDEYAIDAFKVNSIAYLLKPISFMDLSQALTKLDALKAQLTGQPEFMQVIQSLETKKYKDRFLVKLGNNIHTIKAEDIALFYADGRVVYLMNAAGKKYILNYKLEELESLIDPSLFFRVNRTFVLNINGIKEVRVYSNSRLSVTPTIQLDKSIIVSRDRVGAFKDWLEGN